MSDEYRVSWEMPSTTYVATAETLRGAKCWPSFDWDEIPEWHEVSRITTNPWDQYNTLSEWARTREQPIRNVRLQKRDVPDPDDGWIDVRRPSPLVAPVEGS